jgi:hypothetical protein
MNGRWSHAVPLLLICAAALLLFAAPLMHNEVLTFRDHSDYFMPLRFFTALHLRAWRLPLWNPYSASGEPWLANPQTAVFYPPSWIFIVLPFRAAYVLFLAFHIALLGCGAYVLFLRSASRGAATVGAIALMFCGPVLSMLDVGDNLASFAWLPWVLAAALRPSTKRVYSGAVCLALCFLAGEPFIAAIAAIAFVLLVRRIREIAITAAMTIGLCAIELLPFLELVQGSDRRGGFTERDILRDSMPIWQWWRVAVPPTTTAAGYDASLSQHFVPIVYIGVLTTALAIVGIIIAAIQRRRGALGWIALLILSIVIGAGPTILVHLPVTVLRYPARMVPFGAFALIALAVIGWDRIRNRSNWLDALAIVVIVCELIPAAMPLLRTGPTPHVPYGASFGGDAKIVRLGDIDALRRGESRETWIAGYLNLLDRRFDAWTASPLTSRKYSELYIRALQDASSMKQISAGYVLSSQPLSGAGIVPLVRTDRVFATKIADTMPMARVVSADGAIVPVHAVALDATSARAIVDSRDGGLLVLTQCDAMGWRVAVDGARAREEVVDGVFRAVHVGPGHHDVRWTYSPPSLLIGMIITIVSIITLIVVSRMR